ncbi:hypothetical protein NM688_g6481 [Phlebia brevispora]|uniref:Uncharacterized protein n=1 Tax=Phlebia brevispora TaxID=194682 RepID=A0ACC1SFX7_9APHY|nr:hypothetical protein NM688_g6481 [Phlebia brevispora]
MATLLPAELLVRIFKDLRDMFIKRSETDYQLDPLKWLPVNRVCRFWRQAALGDPTLWTHISMCDDNLDCVRTFVERSGSRPQLLHVRVPLERFCAETNNRDVLGLVMGEAYRVRYLEFESKRCRRVLYNSNASSPLRKLVVTALLWAGHVPPPTIKMWHDALEKMRHLEHFLLDDVLDLYPEREQIHGGEHTRSPLRLDRLKTLSIHFGSLQQSIWFFQSLCIPSTASMHVKYVGLEGTRLSEGITPAFAAIAACRSPNRKRKLISLDLDDSMELLEVSCWDTAFPMPLCSRKPHLLTEDMRTHLLLRISLEAVEVWDERYDLYMGIADILQNAFVFTDVVSVRIASRWLEQATDEVEAAMLAPFSAQEYRTIYKQMTCVKTLAISRDTSPQQINCMLGMDPTAFNSPAQPPVPPLFPRLEELTLYNMCLWQPDSWEVPCEIPYDEVLRAVNVRKAMGCGIRSLRIRDAQDGELEDPVYAQLRAAVPELDVQRSSTCTCHSSKPVDGRGKAASRGRPGLVIVRELMVPGAMTSKANRHDVANIFDKCDCAGHLVPRIYYMRPTWIFQPATRLQVYSHRTPSLLVDLALYSHRQVRPPIRIAAFIQPSHSVYGLLPSAMGPTITSLPPELLARIFMQLRDKFALETDNPLGWLTVNCVCRSWRHTALSDPTLWTHVFMRDDNFDCVRTFVERSRPQSLVVYVPMESDGETTNNVEVLNLVVGEAYRVRRLELERIIDVDEFEEDDSLCSIHNLFGCAFPELEELHLVGCEIDPLTLVTFPTACPKLRTLSVECSQDTDFPRPRPTLEMWCNALRKMPRLEHLALEHAFECERGLNDELPGERKWVGGPVQLAHLEVLSVHTNFLSGCTGFFRALSIPPTAKVHFSSENKEGEYTAALLAAVTSCLSRNNKRKLASLEINEMGHTLEVSCWDETPNLPLRSKATLLGFDMATAPPVRISIKAYDRRNLHWEVANMLRNAYVVTDTVAVRVVSTWWGNDTYQPVKGIAPIVGFNVVFREMTNVNTLVVSRNTSPRQLNSILDRVFSDCHGSVQPSGPPVFPKLEELALENTCGCEDFGDSEFGPCGISYEHLLLVLKERKDMGSSLQILRIRDKEEAGAREVPFDAQLRAAASELDVEKSFVCTCQK